MGFNMNENNLIVYYAWSGNTGSVAGNIQQHTGGTLFKIEPVKVYPSNYGPCVDQAKEEINTRVMPELKAYPYNIESYERIFIGTPIWWYTMTPPLLTFLSNSELLGKTVIPFCTHSSGGKRIETAMHMQVMKDHGFMD